MGPGDRPGKGVRAEWVWVGGAWQEWAMLAGASDAVDVRLGRLRAVDVDHRGDA